MRVLRLSATVMFSLLLYGMFGGLVSAHHSTAGYDLKKQITLRGVVVEYRWRNPHVYIVWDVKDESGTVVRWTGCLSSVTTMMQDGMSKNSLKMGDEIILTVNPLKNGNPLATILKISTVDGKPILAGPQ